MEAGLRRGASRGPAVGLDDAARSEGLTESVAASAIAHGARSSERTGARCSAVAGGRVDGRAGPTADTPAWEAGDAAAPGIGGFEVEYHSRWAATRPSNAAPVLLSGPVARSACAASTASATFVRCSGRDAEA